MTLYYYMYRSWQDCCKRVENWSWPSVSVESVDIEYWCLNNALVYAFIMRLTDEERVLPSTFKLNTLLLYCVAECIIFRLIKCGFNTILYWKLSNVGYDWQICSYQPNSLHEAIFPNLQGPGITFGRGRDGRWNHWYIPSSFYALCHNELVIQLCVYHTLMICGHFLPRNLSHPCHVLLAMVFGML